MGKLLTGLVVGSSAGEPWVEHSGWAGIFVAVTNLTSSRTAVPSMGCGYLVCLVLGLCGLGLLLVAQKRFGEHRQPDGWLAAGFGTVLALGSLALVAPMQRAVAAAKDRAQREAAKPDAPWTWDPRWTEPNGIPQSDRRHGRALLIFALAALVISSPAAFAISSELRKGNQLIWVALIFPAVSVGIFAVAALDAWRRRKYGTARFIPGAIPIPHGGEVAGMVIVSRPVIATAAGRISADCWSTRVTRAGNKRRQQDEMIAHTERELAPGDWATTGGESRLFLQVPLRGGQPTTMTRLDADNPTYEWRLRVETPASGADFVAEFVLPVFGTVGAEAAGWNVGTPMRTGAARDRGEAFRAAGIQEVPQPGAAGNTALVFPRGLGRKHVSGPLIMTLLFGALATFLWLSPVPGFIAAFVTLFAVLPAFALKSLWSGGGEKAWVERDAIFTQVGAGQPRRIVSAEVLRVESNRSVGVGAQQFYRVVALMRPMHERRLPRRTEIASMVRGDEATAAVIAWLEERLTRP